jgi:hypothetical protein
MKVDLCGNVINFSHCLEILFIGICSFSICGNEIMKQFEGCFYAGVLFWDSFLLKRYGAFGHFIDLLDSTHIVIY